MADFPTLVGRFIHHCGALEFLINNGIRALSRDDVLSAHVIKAAVSRRLAVMQRFINERSGLSAAVITSSCDDLNDIYKKRNIVAHNPIVSEDSASSSGEIILAVRHRPDGCVIPEKITRVELTDLVKRSKEAIEKFAQLVPEATKT